jgi:hypothetical protein
MKVLWSSSNNLIYYKLKIRFYKIRYLNIKIISFDVGLRNLAYCILDGTESNLKILNWGLIDIMAESSGNGNVQCYKCKKPATWKQEEKYACTKHRTITKQYTKTLLMKMSIENLMKEAEIIQVNKTTKKDLVNALYSHYSKNIWKRCVKSCKAGSVVDLAPLIASSLTSRTSMWTGASLVIFEQQPDKRMLAVQSMMHMWFVCHGYKVKGVSAVHKLTNIVTIDDSTKTYKGRKKTGILHTEKLCPSEWLDYFKKHPKKDDLADCFLQGLWMLKSHKHHNPL